MQEPKFKVGDIVKCISVPSRDLDEKHPKEGETYVVTCIFKVSTRWFVSVGTEGFSNPYWQERFELFSRPPKKKRTIHE